MNFIFTLNQDVVINNVDTIKTLTKKLLKITLIYFIYLPIPLGLYFCIYPLSYSLIPSIAPPATAHKYKLAVDA